MTEQQTPYTTTPPNSPEAEASLLGSILLDAPHTIAHAEHNNITPASFFCVHHATIYTAIQQMHNNQQPIDLITLCEHLAAHDQLPQIGGPATLENLITQTPTIAHAEHYAKIIAKHAKRRAIIQLARQLETNAYTTNLEPQDILDQTEQKLLNLTDNHHPEQNWQTALTETIDQIHRYTTGDPTAAGIPTGIPAIDNKIHGFKNSDLIILAARPSQGKTSLIMNIAENISLGNIPGHIAHNIALFSLEMSTTALAMRMITSRASISSHHIQAGHYLSTPAKKSIARAHETLKNCRIHPDDTGALDIAQLRARARRLKHKHNISIILIDYLQLLNSSTHARHGRQIETMHISGQLKAMAKELNIPVIALSQLSRAVESRDGRPRLSDLRDSGAIEQDADIVAFLRRPNHYKDPKYTTTPNLAILDIAKYRNGPTGEVYLNFDAPHTRFTTAPNPNATPAHIDLTPAPPAHHQPPPTLFGIEQ